MTLIATGWFWVLYFPLVSGPDSLLAVRVVQHSIRYDYPDLEVYQYIPRTLLRVLYVLTVALPMALGGGSWGRVPGLILAASALVTLGLYEYAFVSVWCFFAAVMSVYLVHVVRHLPGTVGRDVSDGPT
jgi:hypothetical protein